MNKRLLTFSLLILTISCTGFFVSAKDTLSLNGKWELSFWEQPSEPVRSPDAVQRQKRQVIAATVPRNVELDLLAAGLIKDPMVGNNANELRPWEGYQWCYVKEFVAPKVEEDQRIQLFFGGIDCLADIWVNGKLVGTAENMLIEHTFDVTDVLRQGRRNELHVIIRSAVLEGQKKLLGPFSISGYPAPEAMYVRKAAHTFGWDILPRLVSAGLWRDVELRVQKPVCLRDVHYMTTWVDAASHSAGLYIETQLAMPLECFDKVSARYTLMRGGKEVYRAVQPVVSPAMRHSVHVEDADLWWPRGYGDAALYDAKVELLSEDGKILAEDNRRIGLRTVKLERTDINLPDEPGKFCFIVNGERIFIHGTNWVPIDALHSRDVARVDEVVDMAVDLNCNMIRCWGGNVYEDHRFFDLCDENGILVWQDFAMGCAFYPQRMDFVRSLEQEVISVVCKLRNHPSIALWSGNNECDVSLRWSLAAFNIDPNRDVITRQLIPSVIYEFDPTRPYLPSSPYVSEAVYKQGSAEHLLPENHLWGPRGYYKEPFYTDAACAFVSEIGYHGCPNEESLRRMMTPECVYPWVNEHEWNDEWVTKSVRSFAVQGKTYSRNNLMLNQIRLLFGKVPDELGDFIFASQSVQAEAMKYFVEKWRGNKPNKTGIIWWNLRDGWPVISDALVDYYGSKKMAYYFIRNVQHDACLMMLDSQEGGYPLVAVNDTREECDGTVKVTDVDCGKLLYEGSFAVPANGCVQVSSISVNELQGQGVTLIEYNIGGRQYANHYLYGKAPFDVNRYKEWLRKTEIYDLK